ncbi:hypothetical protein GCM10027570_07790 [Streptomonospora sediminis]
MLRSGGHWNAYFPELASAGDVDSLIRRISGPDAERMPDPPADTRTAPAPRPAETDAEAAAAARGADGGLFSGFLATVLGPELAELDRTIRSCPLAGPGGDDIFRALAGRLFDRARGLCLRTLVTELHDHRERSVLTGADSRARYAEFERITAARSYADSLARRYPGLVPVLSKAAADFVANLRVMLARTRERLPELSAAFDLGDQPSITGIISGMGDTHRNGRTVSFLDFANGTRIVYKPRPMQVERAYHELARRMSRESGLPIGSLQVVAGDDCGWEEFAAADPAAEPGDAEDFYRNTGTLVCLLHFLRATDVHYQNIVRRGTVPCLIDAETLMANNLSVDGDRKTDKRAAEELSRSVKMIGLLPSVIENPNNELGVMDVGLLGYTQGQVSPFKSLVVVNSRRDDMRLEFQNLPIGDPDPAPRLETPEAEISAVVAGFETAYDWITDRKSRFSGWVRELFGDVAVRFVAENTHFYTQLLRMGTHPTLQDGGHAKRLLFHRVGVGRPDVPAAILRAEIEDLLNADVPYFSLRTGSTDVYDSRGRDLGRYLQQRPIDSAVELIGAASPADRKRNAAIIRLSYVSKLRHAGDRTGFTFGEPSEGGRRPREQTRNDAADSTEHTRHIEHIAAQLVSQRIDGTGALPPTWIGARISPTALQYWKVEELGTDFYSGSPGLAYFLGQAGSALGRAEWTDSALQYFTRMAERLVEHGIRDLPHLLPGMYTGAGGIAYAMHNLAAAAGAPELSDLAAELWRRIPEALSDETEFDVLGGAGGLLGASIALAERFRGTRHEAVHLEAATAFYARTRRGIEALRADPAAAYYSGYAHGVSGVYPYLLRYGAMVGDADGCADLVDFLLDRERDLFDERTGTWAIGSDSAQPAHGWCHGAPGMLLAKCLAATFEPARSDELRAEIRLLLDTCLSSSFGHNLTLCHGDLGNLQIVGFAAEVLGDTALQARAQRRFDDFAAVNVPALLTREGNRHVLAESVMAGRCGIGLALLQRSRPEAVPPTLWFLR